MERAPGLVEGRFIGRVLIEGHLIKGFLLGSTIRLVLYGPPDCSGYWVSPGSVAIVIHQCRTALGVTSVG